MLNITSATSEERSKVETPATLTEVDRELEAHLAEMKRTRRISKAILDNLHLLTA